MNEKTSESVLPTDFDGIFRFTNWTERDFVARWNSVDYLYPSHKTSPMIIPNATPEEIQNIRKKFAKDLAQREFFASQKMKSLEGQSSPATTNSFHQAGVYSDGDLAEFTQRCLEPLPMARAVSTKVPEKPLKLRQDAEGNQVTEVIRDPKKSLKGQGSAIDD